MYTVKWSVLQYIIIRPLVSLAGIVCEKYNVLCESEGFDYRYADVYLEVIDFVSIRCVFFLEIVMFERVDVSWLLALLYTDCLCSMASHRRSSKAADR